MSGWFELVSNQALLKAFGLSDILYDPCWMNLQIWYKLLVKYYTENVLKLLQLY